MFHPLFNAHKFVCKKYKCFLDNTLHHILPKLNFEYGVLLQELL